MRNVQFPAVLQERIEREIISGDLTRLSTISFDDLMQRFKSSEADLALVISGCIRKGLLRQSGPQEMYTVLGKSQPEIISVFQHAAKSGLAPKSVVRAVEIVSADELVAAKLMIEPGDPVYKQTRTRIVNDEVIANQNNYIPFDVCPGLESVDLSQTSFQTVLEGKFNAVVDEIKENYEISSASQEDAEILGINPGDDLLIVQRLSLSSNGFPLVWADIHVRPDRYHYVKDLWPEAAEVLRNLRGTQ